MIVLTSNSDSTCKAQRRYWEVSMIVLTMRNAACSVYCLTMAQHCPLPGQLSAIARHKTIRREFFYKKAPLFFSLFTLHQIGWNPDKHWGCERWRVTLHSSPLFTTFHLRIAHGIESEARPVRSGAETTFFTSHRFHRFLQIFRKRLRVKSGWRVA